MGIEGMPPQEESLQTQLSRFQRASHYLNRRIVPYSPRAHIREGFTARARLEKNPFLGHSEGEQYIEGMTSQFAPIPPGEERIYRTKGQTSVQEEMRHIVILPDTDKGESLLEQLIERCKFTPFQMWRWINGISYHQLVEMTRVIAESKVPLRYSWSEKEVLHEIKLATDISAQHLNDVSAASVVGTVKEGDVFVRTETRLLRPTHADNDGLTHYLTLHKQSDHMRTSKGVLYSLRYDPSSRTYEEANQLFRENVELMYGGAALKKIRYFSQPKK